MTFRTKLLLVTILPVLLISIAALWLISTQSQRLAKKQGEVVETLILNAKETELRNYVKLARTAVEPFYQWDNVSRLQAQKQVADIISRMNFGNDGYFFVSQTSGNALENPLLDELESKERFLGYGQEVASVANKLGSNKQPTSGLYQYHWLKPSTGTVAEKIGMSVTLDNWNWIIGSGLYVDEISAQIGQVQEQLEENVRQTRWVLLAMAAGAVALTSILLAFVRFSEQRFADARLKELAREIVDAQEKERKRVSTELHDGISQLLVSARYGLDLASENAKNRPDIYDPVNKSIKAIATAISEIRRISMALRPSVLDDMGLAAAVQSLGEDFEEQTGIQTQVDVTNIGTRLDERQKTTLYRVAQEALANIAKHAEASRASISLTNEKAGVRLVITDNGNGIQTKPHHGNQNGMGLRNIRERLEGDGGTFDITSNSKEGTKLDIFLPKIDN